MLDKYKELVLKMDAEVDRQTLHLKEMNVALDKFKLDMVRIENHLKEVACKKGVVINGCIQ